MITKIGLGSVQFGTDYGISNKNGITSNSEVEKILEYARKNQIQYIDTAYAYGKAEEVLGQFNLSSFKIISKYIPTKLTLEEQFNTSLKRLNIRNFYGYLAHRPQDLLVDDCKNWHKLSIYKEQGLVKKIGASFNTTHELDEILNSSIKLDLVQVPFNFFDNRFVEYLKVLKKTGCEIHTRSTFLQGLFFCNPDELDSFFEPVKIEIARLQEKENLSQELLRYVLQKEYVDVVILGINNLNQLKENTERIDYISDTLVGNKMEISNQILTPSKWPKK